LPWVSGPPILKITDKRKILEGEDDNIHLEVYSMFIDAHAHLGYEYAFEEDMTLEELPTNMDTNKIDISIVRPGTVFDPGTVMKQHNAIAVLAAKMIERIFGMANPNLHLSTRKYHNELERCVKDLGFVGVKLHGGHLNVQIL